ncbi:hypothetical protein RI054_09g46610 [Pseudoscourfieldia marina]
MACTGPYALAAARLRGLGLIGGEANGGGQAASCGRSRWRRPVGRAMLSVGGRLLLGQRPHAGAAYFQKPREAALGMALAKADSRLRPAEIPTVWNRLVGKSATAAHRQRLNALMAPPSNYDILFVSRTDGESAPLRNQGGLTTAVQFTQQKAPILAKELKKTVGWCPATDWQNFSRRWH